MSRKQYEEDVRKKLDELAKEIDQLSQHIKSIEHELDDEHHEGFAKLRDLQADTSRLFHELLEAGDDAFASAQSKLEDYWSTLGREIKAYDQKLKGKD